MHKGRKSFMSEFDRPFDKPSGGKQGQTELDRQISEILEWFIRSLGYGLWIFLKSLITKWVFFTVLTVIAIFWGIYQIAAQGEHIIWIHELAPTILTMERLDWMYDHLILHHAIILSIFPYSAFLIILGMVAQWEISKYEKIFFSIGLTNSQGVTPKLKKKVKLSRARTAYHFYSPGIKVNDLKAGQNRLKCFSENVLKRLKRARALDR